MILKNPSVKENLWPLQPAPAHACHNVNSKSKAVPHTEVYSRD